MTAGSTQARHLPSLATYSGSRPRISQAPRTASFKGILDSSSTMPTPAWPHDFVEGGGYPAPGGSRST